MRYLVIKGQHGVGPTSRCGFFGSGYASGMARKVRIHIREKWNDTEKTSAARGLRMRRMNGETYPNGNLLCMHGSTWSCGELIPFRVPKPLSILIPSYFPQNGVPVVKSVSFAITHVPEDGKNTHTHTHFGIFA